MTSNALGTYIRERRVDLGLTQEQLAERMGRSYRQSDISRLESGRVQLPQRQNMEQLAAALGVSLGTLLHHSGWLSDDEGELVDATHPSETRSMSTGAIRAELTGFREILSRTLERLDQIEAGLDRSE